MATPKESIFTGAVVVGAVVTGSGTVKVAQRLTDGRISLGTFYRNGSGDILPKSGGIVVDKAVLTSLATQVKANRTVDLSTLDFPEALKKAPAKTKAVLAEENAELMARLAALEAKLAS